jgi:hypothetical protein
MEELKKEIELIGGQLLETSDGIIIRAFSEREVREIQRKFRERSWSLKCSLGPFVECDLYGWYYYEAVLK